MLFQKSWMSYEQVSQLLEIHSELLEITNHAIVVTNIDGHFEWISQNYCAMIGCQLEDLEEKMIQDTLVMIDENFYKCLLEGIYLQPKWDGELTIRRFDQTLLREKVEVAAIFDHKGEIAHIAWTFLDVIRRKDAAKRLKFEIDMAKNIQRSVLSPAIVDENISIHAAYFPSEMLAGDMYAWFQIDDNRYGIVLIDVMGHGMASALVSMSIRSLLRGMVVRLQDPVKIIDEINKHMCNLFTQSESVSENHLTAMCLIIDTKQKKIQYVNAGHPPAYLYCNQRLEVLDVGTFILGAFPNMPISKGIVTYTEHAKVILYTDGLLDAIGTCPIESKKCLSQYVAKYCGLNNAVFVQQLVEDVQLAQRQLVDDVCFISITL